MQKICLINNYNYGNYLGDAVKSAINQTIPFDKVVVIDDGSTDNSIEVLKKFSEYKNLAVYRKENKGQLSCFKYFFKNALETDCLVFFLDSDDVYPLNYVEIVSEFVSSPKFSEYEFIFCDANIFRNEEQKIIVCDKSKVTPIIYPPCSNLVRKYKVWIGNVTSSLILSSKLLKKIIFYPYETEWRTRADDVLVYGASILGYPKLYLKNLKINYRVHGNNSHFGKRYSIQYELRRKIYIERFFRWLCIENYLDPNPSFFHALKELCFMPDSRFLPHKLKLASKIIKVIIKIKNLLKV